MFRYLGCFIIITSMALIGKFISLSVGNRIDEVKNNLDRLKKSASDYEVFGMNINCTLEKCEHLRQADRKLFDNACQINDIDELKELIEKTEEHYSMLKEKNEWLTQNSVVLSILIGFAIITLLY